MVLLRRSFRHPLVAFGYWLVGFGFEGFNLAALASYLGFDSLERFVVVASACLVASARFATSARFTALVPYFLGFTALGHFALVLAASVPFAGSNTIALRSTEGCFLYLDFTWGI
jgi:hypothetical protein